MKVAGSTTFVMNAQYCLARCCHYVEGGPVSEDQYEANLSHLPSPPRQTLGNPKAFQEVMIPCQNIDLHKAVGQQIGFYLGEQRDRTAVFTIKPSGPLNVYDAKSREYLRIATEEDIKKWNDAIEAAVREARELEKNWPGKNHETAANGPRKYC
jgi:hypothetical protein